MRVIIEADSITSKKLSGIGHSTLEVVRQLDSLLRESDRLILIIPFSKKKYVESLGFEKAKIRRLPPFPKFINYLLVRTGMPIPMDLLYGVGHYIFPNYKNWYVPFSKSLTIVPDVAFKIYPDTINKRNLSYLNNNISRWLRRTDKIVTISNSSSKELKEFFPEYAEKITYVHLGVDASKYHHISMGEVNRILKKYGLPNKYFLFVGNIEPRKNILLLLDAYETYAKTEKDFSSLVLIGGDGWNNDNIRDRIRRLQEHGLKVFRPAEYILDDDLPAIYSGAVALIHIAIHEGFGLPPIEALSCGTPVIASNIPSLLEILPKKGVKFVSTNNRDEIVDAMKNPPVVDHPQTNLFDWANTAKKLLKLTG